MKLTGEILTQDAEGAANTLRQKDRLRTALWRTHPIGCYRRGKPLVDANLSGKRTEATRYRSVQVVFSFCENQAKEVPVMTTARKDTLSIVAFAACYTALVLIVAL